MESFPPQEPFQAENIQNECYNGESSPSGGIDPEASGAIMKTLKISILLLLGLLLSGCIKAYVIGHTDDWADYMFGESDINPLAGGGVATIEFQRIRLKCTGSFKDYYKPPFGIVGGKSRGELTCDDGRTIQVESVALSMSHGSGTGVDSYGNKGTFAFYTDPGAYEADLAQTREEVSRRNLSTDHLSGAKPQALTPAVPAVSASPASTSPVATAASGKRLALIIGNANYREAPLKNPINDARALAAKLRQLGFEVMLGENLQQREMTRLITSFGEKLAGKSVGMFYYAGHGMQVKGRNYLLPVDAQITSEASARSESIDLEQVLEHLSNSGTPFNLVILDACRNNPFERRFRGSSGGLAQVDAPKGTLIAFATAPGKVALDGEGRNSTYTTALLKNLAEPGISVESMFKRVRGEVAQVTNDQQIPWESSSLTGDFYFVAMPASGREERKAGETELLFWQSIKDSNDAADFSAYLKKYPNGQFADIARNRLKKLGK